MTHHDYEALCQEIWHHDKLYYSDNSPIITDQEYDLLYKKLEAVESKHPEWIKPSSPTQRVGEVLTTGFLSVLHKTPMLSLANTYSKEEIEDFIKRIQKLTGKSDCSFSCELKMDGIAVSVLYEKGVFIRAVTRGNGKKGDDITANIKTIASLPLRLYGNSIPNTLEIRGEVFMPHKAFEKLNKERKSAGDDLWANPRNAAAGSLKLLDPQEAFKRQLEVVFYGIAAESTLDIAKQHELHDRLRSLGLPTLQHKTQCRNLDEILGFTEEVRELRIKLPFDIDGVVIKLDDLQLQKKLGTTDKNPRWAVAYKFAAEQAMTRITAILVNVGRTGALTPVAEMEPVFVSGSTIARATLHNEDEIERKDIRVGDTVWIEKGGDVIPKVVCVDLNKRPPGSQKWVRPTHCPSCGSKAVRMPDEVALRCLNSKNCPEQRLRYITYFAGKDAFDIENMGEKVVEQLFQKGFIRSPSDIFILTENQLFQLDNFKEKSVHNLMTSIDKARHIDLTHFIMGLSIKHIGTGTAEFLAEKSGDISALIAMSKEQLLEINGIGEIVASSVVAHFADPDNLSELNRLLENGVRPQQVQVVSFEGHAFKGKTFVLTGTLPTYTRDTAAALIKARGGKIAGSVSKNTNYLLAGESAGSKLDKAQALGIKILSEEEFKNLI